MFTAQQLVASRCCCLVRSACGWNQANPPTPCLQSSQVRASSPACRSTDPKALVGAGFARCNFAGPRMEDGQLSRLELCGIVVWRLLRVKRRAYVTTLRAAHEARQLSRCADGCGVVSQGWACITPRAAAMPAAPAGGSAVMTGRLAHLLSWLPAAGGSWTLGRSTS